MTQIKRFNTGTFSPRRKSAVIPHGHLMGWTGHGQSPPPPLGGHSAPLRPPQTQLKPLTDLTAASCSSTASAQESVAMVPTAGEIRHHTERPRRP